MGFLIASSAIYYVFANHFYWSEFLPGTAALLVVCAISLYDMSTMKLFLSKAISLRVDAEDEHYRAENVVSNILPPHLHNHLIGDVGQNLMSPDNNRDAEDYVSDDGSGGGDVRKRPLGNLGNLTKAYPTSSSFVKKLYDSIPTGFDDGPDSLSPHAPQPSLATGSDKSSRPGSDKMDEKFTDRTVMASSVSSRLHLPHEVPSINIHNSLALDPDDSGHLRHFMVDQPSSVLSHSPTLSPRREMTSSSLGDLSPSHTPRDIRRATTSSLQSPRHPAPSTIGSLPSPEQSPRNGYVIDEEPEDLELPVATQLDASNVTSSTSLGSVNAVNVDPVSVNKLGSDHLRIQSKRHNAPSSDLDYDYPSRMAPGSVTGVSAIPSVLSLGVDLAALQRGGTTQLPAQCLQQISATMEKLLDKLTRSSEPIVDHCPAATVICIRFPDYHTLRSIIARGDGVVGASDPNVMARLYVTIMDIAVSTINGVVNKISGLTRIEVTNDKYVIAAGLVHRSDVCHDVMMMYDISMRYWP